MTKLINFFKGHPTLALLPNEDLAAAFRKVIVDNRYHDYELSNTSRHPLQYGTDPGNLEIRTDLVRWSNSKFGRTNDSPDSVNLTGGASFGAANILTAISDPLVTKQVFLVSPTYFLINYAFIDAGFEGKMSAVRETPGGKYEIDLDGLESKLSELDAQFGLDPVTDKEINIVEDPTGRGPRKQYRYAMYLVPTFSNPGGITYSYETRLKLIQIARKHDLLLISDDVYDYLSYDGKPPVLKLNHIDEDTLPEGWRFGNTVSNCSFSKIVAPGLRAGWQETATPALAQQLATTGANKSGGAPSQLNSFVVHEFVASGTLDATISRFVETYKARADVLKAAVKKYLPKNTKLYGGDGGYFLWVEIEGLDVAESLEDLAKDHKVVIPDGHNFEVTGDELGWGKKCARLCVALLTEEEIEEGIRRWGEQLREKHAEIF
ncbi:CIC11C00000003139 [Sungouiella intermedia]|uniref:CIC11C00000003139 n=1 Tax=Sungouiella intermedia TaxID=45354 RepID=A0A1L0G9J6_9ASCO|nr:CIC11C00000003139 [[Candida] intermedia]